MQRRTAALLVIATGVVMVLIALLADVLGIGEEGFGWRRGALLAAGIVVVLAGVAYLMAPARARDAAAEQRSAEQQPAAAEQPPPAAEQPRPADDR
jgi:type VI protein secretion system component VasK